MDNKDFKKSKKQPNNDEQAQLNSKFNNTLTLEKNLPKNPSKTNLNSKNDSKTQSKTKSHKLNILDQNELRNKNSSKNYEEYDRIINITQNSRNETDGKLLTNNQHIETDVFLLGRETEMKNLKMKAATPVGTNSDFKNDNTPSPNLLQIKELDRSIASSEKSANSSKIGSKKGLLSAQNSLSLGHNDTNKLSKNNSKDYEEDKDFDLHKRETLNNEPKFRYLKRKEKIVSLTI